MAYSAMRTIDHDEMRRRVDAWWGAGDGIDGALARRIAAQVDFG